MQDNQRKPLLNAIKALIDLGNFPLAADIMNYVEAEENSLIAPQQTSASTASKLEVAGQEASALSSTPVGNKEASKQ